MEANPMFPIIDGHNDALMDYTPVGKHTPTSFVQRYPQRQLDLPSLQAGNVRGGFFAVFIPDDSSMSMVHNFSPDEEYVLPALDLTYAQRMTQAMVANLFRIEAASNGQFKVVRTADEMQACMDNSIVGAVLHFEGAEAIDAELAARAAEDVEGVNGAFIEDNNHLPSLIITFCKLVYAFSETRVQRLHECPTALTGIFLTKLSTSAILAWRQQTNCAKACKMRMR
jgi:hypothetical protein